MLSENFYAFLKKASYTAIFSSCTRAPDFIIFVTEPLDPPLCKKYNYITPIYIQPSSIHKNLEYLCEIKRNNSFTSEVPKRFERFFGLTVTSEDRCFVVSCPRYCCLILLKFFRDGITMAIWIYHPNPWLFNWALFD